MKRDLLFIQIIIVIKAKDIDHNNYVSANFFWNNLEKQVRITRA